MEAEIQTTSSTTVESAEDPSTMILDMISDFEGVDPVELTPPLYSVIEPEALDALFHPATSGMPHTSGYVQFEYRGYKIRVQSDGEIEILNR